ncbi:hypothetical protein AAY473_023652 [Plecturocebus cupreus]
MVEEEDGVILRKLTQGLILSPRLESNGAVIAHCSLELLGLTSECLFVAQAGFELLGLCSPLTLSSQMAGVTGVSHSDQPEFPCFSNLESQPFHFEQVPSSVRGILIFLVAQTGNLRALLASVFAPILHCATHLAFHDVLQALLLKELLVMKGQGELSPVEEEEEEEQEEQEEEEEEEYFLEQGFPLFFALGQHALVMTTYFEHWGKWLSLFVAGDDLLEGPAGYLGPHATPKVRGGACASTHPPSIHSDLVTRLCRFTGGHHAQRLVGFLPAPPSPDFLHSWGHLRFLAPGTSICFSKTLLFNHKSTGPYSVISLQFSFSKILQRPKELKLEYESGHRACPRFKRGNHRCHLVPKGGWHDHDAEELEDEMPSDHLRKMWNTIAGKVAAQQCCVNASSTKSQLQCPSLPNSTVPDIL